MERECLSHALTPAGIQELRHRELCEPVRRNAESWCRGGEGQATSDPAGTRVKR